MLTINHKMFEGTQGAVVTDKCPLGMSTQGDADDGADDWTSGFILGPCFNPSW